MNKVTSSPASAAGKSPASVITGPGGGGITTWSSRIVASADDGYWVVGQSFHNSATTARVGYEFMMFTPIHSFFRFQNVTVPNATTISTATLTLVVGAAASTAFNMRMKGEDVDDSVAYANLTAANDAANTGASVVWRGAASWATSDVEVSPDIKTVIQEIVNRGGWASGNDLTLRLHYEDIATEEDYEFKTFDDSAGVSALLTIQY